MTDIYAAVKAHFETVSNVTVNQGKGAQGMKAGKKMFAMFSKGDLVLYFPKERVQELIASGAGKPHTLTNGFVMEKQVLILAKNSDRWIEYCTEARALFEKK